MQRRSLFSLGFALALLAGGLSFGSAVLAAGTGGGGTTPSCTADTWSCGSFGDCSAAGYQYRTCTKTYDCATADTPKPPEVQTCTPPAPKPTPAPSGCNADTYSCAPFGACNSEGLQQRTCTKTFDCPTASTPEPALSQACTTLQCGNKPSAKERILCRLQLAPTGLARELAIEYLPEECRPLSGSQRTACIDRYKSFKPCWELPVGEARIACAANAVGLTEKIETAAAKCAVFSDTAKIAACQTEVRDKGFALIKFRMYDLEKRAEAFIAQGVKAETVADFVAKVYVRKAEFNAAATKDARRAAILGLRSDWQAFLTEAKAQIGR